MVQKDELGMRMKAYERESQVFLKRKVPVIGRIDGKAFHTLTRNLVKPYDSRMQDSMQDTAYALMSSIENCVFIYSQSDEISLLLRDYDHDEKGAWFSYNVQKLCSVSASIASIAFTDSFRKKIDISGYAEHDAVTGLFDARFFNIPVFADVSNYFIWRQYDAIRNSISSYSEVLFSSSQLHGMSMKERLDMMKDKGFDWLTQAPTINKMGFCLYKRLEEGEKHAKIYIDTDIPRFTTDREFIERFVYLRDLPDLSAGGAS